MIKLFASICFLLFFINKLYAQELIFAKSAGSNTPDSFLDQGNDVVTDSSGNIYVTGIMSNWSTGSVFGQGEVNQTILNVNGAFIAKYASNGSLLWAKQIEANNYGVVSNAIALDLNNNIYITGYFSIEVTFGVGTATKTTLYANSGSRDAFFAKYTPDGDFLWAKTFGGVDDDAPGGADIEISSTNDIYVTGAFNGSTVFGVGESNETTLVGNQHDVFISKYDINGNLIWAQKAGGPSADNGKNLDLDSSGNVYITGNFYNSATFGNALPNQTILYGDTEAAFIAKYSQNGSFLWAKSPFYITGSGSTISGDIKLIDDNSFVFAGSYGLLKYLSECVTIDGSSEEMVVIQYDKDGNYIWNTTLKSAAFDRGLSLDVDASGNSYVTGYFGGNVVLDEGKCNETIITNNGSGDIFIAVYNINGQLLSVATAGSNGWEQGSAIDVDNSGNIYITGFYRENVTFGISEPNETTLYRNGVNEIYLAKYHIDLSTLPEVAYAGEDNCIELCPNASPIDLFDNLLNNPDSGGTWNPSLSSGTGVFDPVIDPAGIYRYSVFGSGCVSDYAEITINFNGQIDAGDNTLVSICPQDPPFNLFDMIEGTPDPGGTWSPSLASGTNIFDPAIDVAGTYTYTVTKTGCNIDTSQITVNSVDSVNAGENGTISICPDSSGFNLFDVLNGIPDAGGIWTPSLSNGTSVFDPSLDAAGIYTYTISNGVCGDDTSEVTVIMDEFPNAGDDGSLEICINNSPVDLFDSLTGAPDTGGVWTPSLSSGTSVFDPSVDSVGMYTYTVSNGNCGTDTSEVSVTITNVTPISNYEIKINGLSANNWIEIIINSNLDYEYSLDGIYYQSSNIFNYLAGGDYTLFVREINGCGILEENVSILDYPKFFTPNSDGINDTWYLKGRTDQNYSIYIYDRFGKLLKHLTSFEMKWDGTFNGNKLPSSDYWFTLIFENGDSKTGHFTLKL